MNQASLLIENRYALTTSHVFVINCTFELISAKPQAAIRIQWRSQPNSDARAQIFYSQRS